MNLTYQRVQNSNQQGDGSSIRRETGTVDQQDSELAFSKTQDYPSTISARYKRFFDFPSETCVMVSKSSRIERNTVQYAWFNSNAESESVECRCLCYKQFMIASFTPFVLNTNFTKRDFSDTFLNTVRDPNNEADLTRFFKNERTCK